MTVSVREFSLHVVSLSRPGSGRETDDVFTYVSKFYSGET